MNTFLNSIRLNARQPLVLWRARLVLFLLLSCIVVFPAHQILAGERLDSEQLKAALLYKLTRFVTWPDSKPIISAGAIFCVAEDGRFGESLNALRQNSSKKITLEIHYLLDDLEGIDACHVAFSGRKTEDFQHGLEGLIAKPILTVSDARGFAKAGGMIEVVRRNNRLGFVINLDAVKQAGLRIATPLLQMSTLIGGREKEK